MAERCLELLAFPEGEPRAVLDIGCGSGLSGGAWRDVTPREAQARTNARSTPHTPPRAL